MADSFTKKIDKFFDNNTPGGYIQTTVNISDNDLSTRIEQAVRNQGFLTSTSHIPWSQVDSKPTFFSGNYADLAGKPTKLSQFTNDLPSQHIPTINVSNTLASGDLLATITIDGISTDIYGSNNNSGIVEENDPIFSNSPAASITNTNIENWNNKSDFSGDYNDLSNLPNLNADAVDSSIFGLAPIATSGNYYDLNNIPIINLYLQTFSNTLLSDNENNNLHTLGKENIYILNYDKFTNSKNISLKESLDDMISKGLYENYKCYIISELYNFLITNIQLVYNNSNEIIYYILDTIPYHTNNYDEIRYSSNDFSDIIAQQQLDNINITNKDVILIIDREYNVLYCKIKNI